jgi:hypothetical protein
MKKSSTKLESLDKKPVGIEEMMKSLKRVGANVRQIVKLNSEEDLLVAELMASLKRAPQQMFSISVSTSELPIRTVAFTHAHMDFTGHLILTSEDGRSKVMDLNETENRDLMMAVVGEIVPKFKDLASQTAKKKRKKKPAKVKKTPPPPKPVKPTPVKKVPVELPKVVEDVPIVKEEEPVELPTPEVEPVPEEPPVPVLSADEKAKIDQITEETLTDLETLGNEVFNQSPVSVYFDDWLVHIRQVLLGFESSDIIKVDDVFTDECEQIFRDIEDELANRLLREAELEASAKALADKKNSLGTIDDEYAAKTTYIKVRGKSAMDFLVKNVQRLEEELEKTQQIKTFNPIKRLATKQKQYNIKQKLKAAKKRMKLAKQSSAGEQEKQETGNFGYVAHPRSLEVEEETSLDDLIADVQRLEEELAKVQRIKTRNPLKRLTKEQQLSEVTEELNDAKQKLAVAAQKAETEQQRIHAEYEKKKQTTIENVQNLEKEIETKRTDNSLEARKAATNALANAVKSLIQRNNEPNTEDKTSASG